VVTRGVEAAAAAAGGAALGAVATLPLGIPAVGAVVGGLNGAIGGWRRVYEWNRGRGVLAFTLDNTWALLTTAGGVAVHGLNAVTRDAGYSPALSVRANRHVYERGVRMRKGFAITWGNVMNGAGELSGESTRAVRRRRLVTDHEDVHVWQARTFGPLYPVMYLGWMVTAGAAGALHWALTRRHSLAGTMDAWGYYANPFEWWAYSRDGNWPPHVLGDRAGIVWRRPVVRPLAERRAQTGA